VTTSRGEARLARQRDRGGARHPLVELTLARLREFVREPEALFWAFIFPIVMSVAMAVAFPARGAGPVIVGVEDTPRAAAVRQALASAPGVTLRPLAPVDEQRAVRDGDVHVVLVPTDPPTYRFDPAREESRAARLVVDDALKRAAGRGDPWQAREEPIAIAGSRYVDWLIPGLIGLGIMSTGMWGIGFSIVQSRMRKLLKRLVASPMRKREYLLAQLLARLVFLAPEVILPLAFGALVLGMPLRGSWAAIAAVSLAGALAFGALGLLTASRARTFEAINGLLNLAMLPMWIMGGVFFSAANFPDAVQPFIQALPLTALTDALRNVVLEGRTLTEVRGELAILAAWTVVPFPLALKLFRWR
jgi:ABC-type multidrug transport system permease subunit